MVVTNCHNNLLARKVVDQMGLKGILDVTSRDIFCDTGCMDTAPIDIRVKGDVDLYSVCTARCIPFPIMDKVKVELHRMLANEIIREVTEPTPWCAPMVPVIKKSGDTRICVDLRKLNKAVQRKRYRFQTLDNIAGRGYFRRSTLVPGSGNVNCQNRVRYLQRSYRRSRVIASLDFRTESVLQLRSFRAKL